MSDTESVPEAEDIEHENEETDAEPAALSDEEMDEVDPNSETN